MREKIELLGFVFSPATLASISRNKLGSKKDSSIIPTDFHKELYKENVSEITRELKEMGVSITYSTKILINTLSFNLYLFFEISSKAVQQNILHIETYDGETGFKKEGIHPLFDSFALNLQKKINTQLRLLGLLPEQKLQQQKIKFIKKLKRKLYEIEGKDFKEELSAEVKIEQ